MGPVHDGASGAPVHNDDLLVLMHGVASSDELDTTLDALSFAARVTVGFADHTTDTRFRASVESRGNLVVPPVPPATGPIDLIRTTLQHLPRADLAVVVIGAALEDGWYEALRTIAYADSTTATVSAVSVSSSDALSRPTVAQQSGLTAAPPIPKPQWGCVFVRRDAINLALATRSGAIPQSVSFTSALEELVSVPGFVHRMAPTVVAGVPAAPSDEVIGIRRMRAVIEAQRESLSVLIDLRCCAYPVSGTQVQVLRLVNAVAGAGEAELAVLLPDKVDPSLSEEIARLPSTVDRYTIATLPTRRPHVFHRPYQLLSENDLAEAVAIGNRLVITQQDMILSRTPSYFSSVRDWRRFTEMTNVSFLVADHIAFFSPHALGDALSDGVLTTEKASVVPLGTEHARALPAEFEKSTRGFGFEVQEPFLLVLGNAYVHKNRVHALRVFDSLTRDGGWEGILVFAGGHPPVGGSKSIEREYLASRPGLAKRVTDIGPVSESEKRTLYDAAALVLYPSLYEGFGLVPFEAAAFGTPSAYSRRSALGDFLPAEGALLEGWDPDVSAAQIAKVLRDPLAGRVIVEAVLKAGKSLTWASTANAYLEIYRRVVVRPAGFSLTLGEFAIGPAALALTRKEQRLLKAYRGSRSASVAFNSMVSSGIAARRWLRTAARGVRPRR